MLLSTISAFNLIFGLAVLVALMTERMRSLPTFHRAPVGMIAASLIVQAALEITGVDRSQLPVWFVRDLGFFWLAAIAWSTSWRVPS